MSQRKQEILQTIAELLEDPRGEKITTALLAQKMGLSEAALYRHFASKAQMYEALIEFIEESVFTLANQIQQAAPTPNERALGIVGMLLTFGEKNPGMCRILIGDALAHEHERLRERIGQLFARLELTLKTCLKGEAKVDFDDAAAARANLLLAFVIGRWQLYVRSGFKRVPSEFWAAQSQQLM